MKFIIGLGNPGFLYNHTKHNMGFEVVKALAKEHSIKISRKLHFSIVGRGKIAGQDVSFVLPQTFMNLSGKAVGELFSHEVKDIAVPEGVKVLNDGDLITVSVKAKKVEAPKEEVAVEGAEEPELIRKKKEEGEEEGAEAPKEAAKEAAKEPKKG